MKPVLAPLILVLLLLLSGCQTTTNTPSDDETDGDDGLCIETTCPADPASKDYQYALSAYGLYQINTESRREFDPMVEGDLVVWQVMKRTSDGGLADDIIGFNISRGEVLSIGVEENYHQIRQYLRDGRVVFAQQPQPGAPDYGVGPDSQYLVLWDSRTGEKRKLDHGMGGDSLASDFNGEWVVFRLRGAADWHHNGIWAMNVDTAERMYLYRPFDGAKRPDGTVEIPTGEAVADGFVYRAVFRNNLNGTTNTTIYRDNLATGNTTIFHFREGYIQDIWANAEYIVWEVLGSSEISLGILYVYEKSTGRLWSATNPNEGSASFPSLGGEWLTFAWNPFAESLGQIAAYHIPTNSTFTVAQSLREFNVQQSGTDGTRFVTDGIRATLDNFETIDGSVYWGWLPEP